MKLSGDEPVKKSKSLDLISVGKSIKTSQAYEPKESTHDEDSEEDSIDDEMNFIIKRFQYLANKNKRSSSRSSGFRGSISIVNKDDNKGCFNCRKQDHFIAGCTNLQKDKQKKEAFKRKPS